MYNNPYMTSYNSNFSQQSLSDRIDNQIAQLQQMKEQMKNQQPTSINQTFQLAPTHSNSIRYANSLDDVNKEIIYGDTPFFSKDMSVLWVKNAKGEIKTYELNEIVPKDNKDIQIEYLQAQIEELRKEMKNSESNADVVGATSKSIESEEPADVSTVSKFKTKSKQSTRNIE